MGAIPDPLKRCCEELEKLPGIGKRSAQRIVFHILEKGAGSFLTLAEAIKGLADGIDQCPQCRAHKGIGSECPICSNPGRDGGVLCVVESPADMYLIDGTGEFNGRFFVLHALLSPVRGVTPDKLGVDKLEEITGGGGVREIIIATPPTAEGEATASFLHHVLFGKVPTMTRIGFGLPVGTDLQFADSLTISRALSGRREFK